jgi:hypothetical protein
MNVVGERPSLRDFFLFDSNPMRPMKTLSTSVLLLLRVVFRTIATITVQKTRTDSACVTASPARHGSPAVGRLHALPFPWTHRRKHACDATTPCDSLSFIDFFTVFQRTRALTYAFIAYLVVQCFGGR